MNTRGYVVGDDIVIGGIIRRAFAGFPWYEQLTEIEVRQRWQKIVSRRGFDCLVAAIGGKVVGFSCWDTPTIEELASERGPKLAKRFQDTVLSGYLLVWERELVVDPDFQRQGIGMKLRQEFLTKMDHEKLSVLVLTRMREDNLPTIKIAERLGFQRTGILIPSSQKPGVCHEYWLWVSQRKEYDHEQNTICCLRRHSSVAAGMGGPEKVCLAGTALL